MQFKTFGFAPTCLLTFSVTLPDETGTKFTTGQRKNPHLQYLPRLLYKSWRLHIALVRHVWSEDSPVSLFMDKPSCSSATSWPNSSGILPACHTAKHRMKVVNTTTQKRINHKLHTTNWVHAVTECQDRYMSILVH